MELTNSFNINQYYKTYNDNYNCDPQEYIIEKIKEAKFFIAISPKYLRGKSKADFQLSNQKFIIEEIENIEHIKTIKKHLHFIVNKGLKNEVKITLPLLHYEPSGLYMDSKMMAKDVKMLMDIYVKRRDDYKHSLVRSEKNLSKLMVHTDKILSTYPESFI